MVFEESSQFPQRLVVLALGHAQAGVHKIRVQGPPFTGRLREPLPRFLYPAGDQLSRKERSLLTPPKERPQSNQAAHPKVHPMPTSDSTRALPGACLIDPSVALAKYPPDLGKPS